MLNHRMQPDVHVVNAPASFEPMLAELEGRTVRRAVTAEETVSSSSRSPSRRRNTILASATRGRRPRDTRNHIPGLTAIDIRRRARR